MKKWYLYCWLCVVLASCERDPVLRIDYRDDYTGVYNCQLVHYSHPFNSSPTYDTSYVNLYVTIDPNTSDKIVLDGETIFIDASGYSEGYDISAHTTFKLRFRNDSIYYYHTWSSPGGTVSYTYNGSK